MQIRNRKKEKNRQLLYRLMRTWKLVLWTTIAILLIAEIILK